MTIIRFNTLLASALNYIFLLSLNLWIKHSPPPPPPFPTISGYMSHKSLMDQIWSRKHMHFCLYILTKTSINIALLFRLNRIKLFMSMRTFDNHFRFICHGGNGRSSTLHFGIQCSVQANHSKQPFSYICERSSLKTEMKRSVRGAVTLYTLLQTLPFLPRVDKTTS